MRRSAALVGHCSWAMTRTRNRDFSGSANAESPGPLSRWPPYTGDSRAKSLPAAELGLFGQDIGDFAKLGARAQQIEALHGQMVGHEEAVGPAVDDHQRLQCGPLQQAGGGLLPGGFQVLVLDHLGEIL